MKGPTLRSTAGFTMLELLTVLVVVAVLASLAAPSLRGYIEQSRVQGALDRLVGDVAYARMLAVQRGGGTVIRLEGDGSYAIDTLSVTGATGSVRTVRLRDDFGGVTLDGTTSELSFDSRGLLLNQDGESFLRVSRGDLSASLFVSAAGRVYRDF